MITMQDFMQLVNYRITEGSEYYGPFGVPSYCLSYWNGDQNGYNIDIVFSTQTQEVFMAEVCDYTKNRAYRLINPAYQNLNYDKAAWDDVDWTDLSVDKDFMEKASAIVNGLDYDDRVQIPVDFADEELLKYMVMAHERDMTFNAFVEEALRHALDEFKRDPENLKARAAKWKADHDIT